MLRKLGGWMLMGWLVGCGGPGGELPGPSDAGPGDTPPTGTQQLTVSFDDGTFGPLVRSYGPNDNPQQADPRFTVEVSNGQARYLAPAAGVGPRLTGFLDLPADRVPITTPLTHEWTFPQVSELMALGGAQGTGVAIAGCYIRGELGHWVGGSFGDYWFGFVRSGGSRVSAIRQGNTNLVTEPFTATQSVSYRIEKNGRTLRLFARYDAGAWHAVGEPVTLTLNAGGSEAVAMTHVRILDTSGTAVSVTADDFQWKW